MPLHPIRALDRVVEEFKDYLRTEFRAKDPGLRAALDAELDRPGFLAQEPFFQAHRPFKPGRQWRDLPLDARLAQVMADRARRFGSDTPEYAFLHQSESIARLLSADAGPTVVRVIPLSARLRTSSRIDSGPVRPTLATPSEQRMIRLIAPGR